MVRNHYFVSVKIGWQGTSGPASLGMARSFRTAALVEEAAYAMISMAQPWLVFYLISKDFIKGYDFFLQHRVRTGVALRRPCGTKLVEYVVGLRRTHSILFVPALVCTVASAGMARSAAVWLHKGASPGQADVQRVRSAVACSALRRGGSSLAPHRIPLEC